MVTPVYPGRPHRQLCPEADLRDAMPDDAEGRPLIHTGEVVP